MEKVIERGENQNLNGDKIPMERCGKFIVPYNYGISKHDRQRLNGHSSFVLWFTGLPSSGKSTIAHRTEKELFCRGVRTYVLDGDNVRTGLNSDLGFSPEDRKENIRRIGEVARLFVDAGIVLLTAFVSPYKKDREFVRNLLEEGEFFEVYVKCPPEVCEQRDPKGHYQKAKKGIIKNYTGVDGVYEAPDSPDLILDTNTLTVDECVRKVLEFLTSRGLINELPAASSGHG